jgi:hypothetical protein
LGTCFGEMDGDRLIRSPSIRLILTGKEGFEFRSLDGHG